MNPEHPAPAWLRHSFGAIVEGQWTDTELDALCNWFDYWYERLWGEEPVVDDLYLRLAPYSVKR